MPKRTSIPAGVTRELLIESGHRCAVCGAPCPLERAHIIPWRKAQQHKVEDMICLCAGCHERADHENWGERTLRKYKKRPWFLRKYEKPERDTQPTIRIELRIKMELRDFDVNNQLWLQYALASFLGISPYAVRIISKGEGSVKVIIELPEQSAQNLLSSYVGNDKELTKHLFPLILLDVTTTSKGIKEFIEHIAKVLVDSPDDVSVKEIVKRGRIVYELRCAEGDLDKLISKEKRMFREIWARIEELRLQSKEKGLIN